MSQALTKLKAQFAQADAILLTTDVQFNFQLFNNKALYARFTQLSQELTAQKHQPQLSFWRDYHDWLVTDFSKISQFKHNNTLALLNKLADKDYFILTSGTEELLRAQGLAPYRFHAKQGRFDQLQCAQACHPNLYEAMPFMQQFNAFIQAKTAIQMETWGIPKCPQCGAPMVIHLANQPHFIQSARQQSEEQLMAWLGRVATKKVLWLDFMARDGIETHLSEQLDTLRLFFQQHADASVMTDEKRQSKTLTGALSITDFALFLKEKTDGE